jgi:hypothetical protein
LTIPGASHRRGIAGPIGAENGGQSGGSTHCYERFGDLVTCHFACLALQDVGDRADPRLQAGDDHDTNGWTVPLPTILTRLGRMPTIHV